MQTWMPSHTPLKVCVIHFLLIIRTLNYLICHRCKLQTKKPKTKYFKVRRRWTRQNKFCGWVCSWSVTFIKDCSKEKYYELCCWERQAIKNKNEEMNAADGGSKTKAEFDLCHLLRYPITTVPLSLAHSDWTPLNSSFTDFPPDQTTPRSRFFLKRTTDITPVHNTGYSYAHAHIAQIKNTKEHCVHVTDHVKRERHYKVYTRTSA